MLFPKGVLFLINKINQGTNTIHPIFIQIYFIRLYNRLPSAFQPYQTQFSKCSSTFIPIRNHYCWATVSFNAIFMKKPIYPCRFERKNGIVLVEKKEAESYVRLKNSNCKKGSSAKWLYLWKSRCRQDKPTVLDIFLPSPFKINLKNYNVVLTWSKWKQNGSFYKIQNTTCCFLSSREKDGK